MAKTFRRGNELLVGDVFWGRARKHVAVVRKVGDVRVDLQWYRALHSPWNTKWIADTANSLPIKLVQDTLAPFGRTEEPHGNR